MSFASQEYAAIALVLCGLLDVVDDEDVGRAFAGFKFEAELFLQGGEDGWAGVGWRQRGGGLCAFGRSGRRSR